MIEIFLKGLISWTIIYLIFALIRWGFGLRRGIGCSKKTKKMRCSINLNNNETIILSVVIGLFIALILGYIFKRDCYNCYNRSYYDEFNYLLAFGSYVVISGISYLCLKRKNISKKEKTIILSIVIGFLIALFLGYVFPIKHYKYWFCNNVGKGVIKGREIDDRLFHGFNYLLAFGSLIIVSGISYLCLIKISSSKEKDNVVED